MAGGEFEWRTVDEARFNEAVNALLVKAFTRGGRTARAIDGRGGDSGIDVGVWDDATERLVRIFQLKYFPGGFATSAKGRRAQIRKSFERAASLEPAEWTLVVPCIGSLNERKFVTTLGASTGIRTTFLGSSELDVQLAEHPEILAWANRSVLREALMIAGQQHGALITPEDVATEVDRVAGRLDAASIYWGRQVAFDTNGRRLISVFAKRPDAAEQEPLSVEVSTRFGPEDEALRLKFIETIDYGAVEPLRLPPEVVTSFRRIGPDWWAGESGPGIFELAANNVVEKPTRLTIEIVGEGRKVLARLPGKITRLAPGRRGNRMIVELEGGITQNWKLENETDGATATFTFQPEGLPAREVLRALHFSGSLFQAEELVFRTAKASQRLAFSGRPPESVRDVNLISYTEDLAYLEDECGISFAFPEKLPDWADRAWTRVAKMLLEGRATVAPATRGFTGELDGELSPGMRELIEHGGVFRYPMEDWVIPVLGQDVPIGDVVFHHRDVRVIDGLDVLAALERGEGEGMLVSIETADDMPILVFSPPRMGSEYPEFVESWSIPGVPDDPAFETYGEEPLQPQT